MTNKTAGAKSVEELNGREVALGIDRRKLHFVMKERDEWRRAAIQGRNDLKAIEEEFAAGNTPIGPGQVWEEWTSPANTIRWADQLEGRDESALSDTGGDSHTTTYRQIGLDCDGWECTADDCDQTWQLADGTPFENHMRYCSGCGRQIASEEPWGEGDGGGNE